MKKKKYQYDTDKEIFSDLMCSFDEYFKPIFDSCGICKRTFAMQIVNFVLFFMLLYLFLGGLLKKFTIGIEGSGAVGVRLFLLIVIVGSVSVFKKNKVLCWQTLFKTNFDLTVKFLKILISLNALFYFAREGYRKYEKRSIK